MRLASLLVLGLAALTPSTEAIRTSASQTLAKLSQRLAAAEAALADLKSSAVSAPGPKPMSQYTFDYSTYADSINTLNKGTVIPSGANNIGFIKDNSRSSVVLVRNPSKTYATSTLSLPVQLSPSFTLLLWVNWAGVAAGTEQHVIDSSDSALQLWLDGNGYYHAAVNGVKLVDSSKPISALTWHFLAVVVDGSAKRFTFFSGDAHTNTKVGTAAATYPGTAPSLRLFNYAALPDATKSWAGEVDSVTVFNYALADSDLADVWWGTNNGAGPTGGAPPAPDPTGFFGHFSQAQVTFTDRYASQPAGDVFITVQVSDIDVDVGDEIRLRFYGCGGTSTTGYVTLPDDGTLASYNNQNAILSLKPQKLIPQLSVYTFHIPASVIQISNPSTIYASASDPNWKLGIVFSSGQIPQTGCHYVGILITPATLNPNALL